MTSSTGRETTAGASPERPPARPDPLPPGPRTPSYVQAVLSLGFAEFWFPRVRRRHGPTFTIRFAPLHRIVVMLSRPDDIRAVFRGDPDTFHAGKGNAILEPLLGKQSLLTQDGEDHARARRLLMPAFGRREISGYRDLVREVTAAQLDRWPEEGPVKAHLLMNTLTLEIILRVVFGVTDTARLERLRPLIRETIELGPVTAIGASVRRLRRIPPWRGLFAKLDELHRLIRLEIDSTRADPALDERTDLLARLVRTEADDGEKLGDDELVDQLMTLVAAGHETTASAVSWTLLEIARHRDVQDRCVREIRTAEDGGHAYLDAVLKESLRVHPVVSIVMRELQAPAEVAGTLYDRMVSLAPNIVLAHQDPENFPEPQVFRPERFLDDPPGPTTWLPFGGGARRCIGAAFALMEGEEILRQVLERYEVTAGLPFVEPPRSRNVTSYPALRARIRLTRRR